MAEALGASAASVQLFETAIEIFIRIKKAYKRHKELASILEKYTHELKRIRDLAESVRTEKALEGAKVTDPLARLKELEQKLCKWLTKVDPGDKTSLRRFADQLVRGQDDRKKLDDIMHDLDRVKSDLNLVIEMHHARGLYKIRRAVSSKSKRIESEKSMQRKKKVATEMAKAPAIPARSDTQLSDSGISSMSSDNDTSSESSSSSQESDSDEPTSKKSAVPMTRRVLRNTAERGAIMVNSPMGEVDLWAHMQVVEIEGNVAGEGAQMFNYMNDEAGWENIKKWRRMTIAEENEQRKIRIAEMREQMLWMRENGFPVKGTGNLSSSLL